MAASNATSLGSSLTSPPPNPIKSQSALIPHLHGCGMLLLEIQRLLQLCVCVKHSSALGSDNYTQAFICLNVQWGHLP